MRTSLVITTRNEAARIDALLDSLVGQSIDEIIVVDALSDDGTPDRLRARDDLPIHVIEQACSRGQGRNLGAEAASGDVLLFTDGDGTVSAGWAAALASKVDDTTIAAGHTVIAGPKRFQGLHRAELAHRGQDTTWPSCNLAYPRALFEKLGGFDAQFITAEDIDLNLRAIDAGAHIVHVPEAVVHAAARSSIQGFLKQAFWNGFGRKQLTQKHGRLWSQYRFSDLLRQQLRSPIAALRMAAGATGYLWAKVRT